MMKMVFKVAYSILPFGGCFCPMNFWSSMLQPMVAHFPPVVTKGPPLPTLPAENCVYPSHFVLKIVAKTAKEQTS